uniref:Golgin subfamily A conserved domain-containing protein n=1 Tax=Pan paniscus TaxID=9597 RepID=A0A2R9AMM0_PANPA
MEWKLEQSMREQALLKAQLTQLKESLKEAQIERDEYAQHLKGERARWQQRMRKMSQEVCLLKKEKQHDKYRVEKLERSLSKLKNQMAEPLPPEPPAVPSEVELQHLRKELERVAGELQAQHMSLLNRQQEERIREQEDRLRKQEERLQEQHEKLQQLAKPQSVFEEPNNENKSALQLEQQVKELQEKLGEERLEAASQQNQQLTAQLSLMALPGKGTGDRSEEEERAPQPMPSVPEDLESREAMSGFMDHLEEKDAISEWEGELQGCWRVYHPITKPGGSAKDAGPGQGGDEGRVCNISAGVGVGVGVAVTEPQPPRSLGLPTNPRLPLSKDLCEVSLTSSAQGEAREDPLLDKPTAQPIVQDHQEHPGLGSNCCVPFFRWAWLPRRRR